MHCIFFICYAGTGKPLLEFCFLTKSNSFPSSPYIREERERERLVVGEGPISNFQDDAFSLISCLKLRMVGVKNVGGASSAVINNLPLSCHLILISLSPPGQHIMYQPTMTFPIPHSSLTIV